MAKNMTVDNFFCCLSELERNAEFQELIELSTALKCGIIQSVLEGSKKVSYTHGIGSHYAIKRITLLDLETAIALYRKNPTIFPRCFVELCDANSGKFLKSTIIAYDVNIIDISDLNEDDKGTYEDTKTALIQHCTEYTKKNRKKGIIHFSDGKEILEK